MEAPAPAPEAAPAPAPPKTRPLWGKRNVWFSRDATGRLIRSARLQRSLPDK